jgi:hypothetical protein
MDLGKGGKALRLFMFLHPCRCFGVESSTDSTRGYDIGERDALFHYCYLFYLSKIQK